MGRSTVGQAGRAFVVCIDAGLVVTLCLAAMDSAAAFRRGPPGALAAWLILRCAFLPGMILGCGLWVVTQLDRLSETLARQRSLVVRAVHVLAACCAATPALVAVILPDKSITERLGE